VEEGMNANGMRSASPALAGLKVLVVEDETVIAFDLEGTLQELGCVAEDVRQALSRLLQPSHA
jgi:CheY-like chemotaxis protein